MLPKPATKQNDAKTAVKRKANSSAQDFPDANSDPGKRARDADVASRGGELSAFNHTGPIKSSVLAMGSGGTTTAKQFRDDSAHSSELPSNMGRGRHEISSTSQRAVLVGNPVAVNVAATARISTALAPLVNDSGEVVGHTGEFAPEMTSGQSGAHQIFHDFGATLATQTDPFVASALAIHTALTGTATPDHIRASTSLTGAKWVGGSGAIEPPDPSRGADDGYDSDTERGRYARRVGVGREHLKDSLTAIRAISQEAFDAVPPPSPRRSRGGRPDPTVSASRTTLTLPDVSADSPEDAAAKLTTFAFAGFQTLKHT
jgi:hypothetical protein